MDKVTIENCYLNGSGEQQNGIVVFSGRDVWIHKNRVVNCFNVGIFIDDATNATAIDDYGRLIRINITNNIISMVTAPAAQAGISSNAAEGLVITDNQIHADGLAPSGKGIEAKLYDNNQQEQRNDGTYGTGEGTYYPIDQTLNSTLISNNTVVNFIDGLLVAGIYAPIIRGNQIRCLERGMLIRSEGPAGAATAAKYWPSVEGATTTSTRGNIEGNTFISLAGSATFYGIEIQVSKSSFVNNRFLGLFTSRYGGTSLTSLEHIIDIDHKTGMASGIPILDKGIGKRTFTTGETVKTVSLVEGGGNILDRTADNVVTDYLVLCDPSWNTTVKITSKTPTGFTVTVGTAAPDNNSYVNYVVVLYKAGLTTSY